MTRPPNRRGRGIRADASSGSPQLSLVMPCFNEEPVLGYTIDRLMSAFGQAGYRVELVAVDNGSTDGTSAAIAATAARHPSVKLQRVEKNIGYGNGIISGISRCEAPWVGIIPADGQVDAEDVVRLFDCLVHTDGWALGKVRRRFRMDGLTRKFVSVTYNIAMRALWPRLGTFDVNGNPKILPRAALFAMRLESRGWLLDPEMMIKARHLGLRIIEFNAFARLRSGGTSHVRAATVWEFITNLIAFRFSNRLGGWFAEDHDIERLRSEHRADTVIPVAIPS